jgi:hypothetical protein
MQFVAVIGTVAADAMNDRELEQIIGPVLGPFATPGEAEAAAKQWSDARQFNLDDSFVVRRVHDARMLTRSDEPA